jgi:CRISPR-associated protein (TIGR03984 family)
MEVQMEKAYELCSTIKPHTLNYISSEDFIDSLIKISAELDGGQGVFLIGRFYDAVRIGMIKNATVSIKDGLEKNDLLDLRMFSAKGELHLWRKADHTFGSRLRIDINKQEDDAALFVCMEEYHAVWGTRVRQEGGWWVLSEDRVADLHFPFKVEMDTRYKVINYARFDSNGILRFVDARLCGFFDYDKHDILIKS